MNGAKGFSQRVEEGICAANSCVCLGLDSDWVKLPASVRHGFAESDILAFNCALIDANADLIFAIKANLAFYLEHVHGGVQTLQRTFAYCKRKAPNVLRILDAKWADIDNTNNGYLNTALNMDADAITVNPYLGGLALKPFLSAPGNLGIIVLCKTSNKGSNEFEDRVTPPLGEEKEFFGDRELVPLYQIVAYRVSRCWENHQNLALVAGATYPKELAEIRRIVGDDVPLLIPGLGKQQGDAAATILAGRNSRDGGIIVNNSRNLIFASSGPDFAAKSREATIAFRDLLNHIRHSAT